MKARAIAEADGIKARNEALAANSEAVIAQQIAEQLPEIVAAAARQYDKRRPAHRARWRRGPLAWGRRDGGRRRRAAPRGQRLINGDGAGATADAPEATATKPLPTLKLKTQGGEPAAAASDDQSAPEAPTA